MVVGLILAVILMFGMFGLSIRQIVWVGLYVLAHVRRRDGARRRSAIPTRYPVGGELVYFMMLCIMVAGVGVLTVRLHRMRDRLRRQKLELEAALAHIQRLATHDELTGLVNRRHMQELLENERLRQRAHRAGLVHRADRPRPLQGASTTPTATRSATRCCAR